MSLKIPSYELVNDNARAYLTEVDYTNDTQYLESFVSNYRINPVTDLTLPLPVTLKWQSTSDYESLKLFVSSDLNFSDAWTYILDPDVDSFDVYNLIPNRYYYWKIEGLNGINETIIEKGNFNTIGSRRLLLIPGEYLGNCRDLGGLPCTGGLIKYGKLIRGGEVLRDDGGPYMKINDAGIYELRERLGVTVELDFGDLWRESPLEGEGFEVYRDHDLYGFYGYDRDPRGLRTTVGRTCLHNCLELVIQKLSENKSIYFHCNSGADRTGTFAFIIEALCGVSDNDKSKDYELTSLWATWYKAPYNRYTNYFNRYRNSPAEGNCGYNTMIEYINSLFSGETLNDKIYDMCTKSIADGGLGITVESIDLLRTLLVDNKVIIQAKNYTREYGDANPTFEYTSEGAALVGTPEITCEATESSPVGTYDIVVKQGSVTNYNVTYVAGTLTITKAPLTIAAGTYTKKQGEEMPEFTLTYDGFKNDETKDVLTKQPGTSCQATIASAPGEYPVTVSGAESQNYEISYTNGKLVVTEADPVTITAKNYTREYGDANPTFEYTSEGAALVGTPEITCEATESSPVGTYDIVVKQGSVTNYNVTYVAGTLTVTKAPLTISAGTYTKKQGEAMPEFTLTYEGFKNDEDESVLIKVPTVTTSATEESEPGEYDVLVSGGEAQNYELSYINGKLTVQEDTGISDIVKPMGSFDVYSINGLLVRKDATSLKGLPKGLYVVNRKVINLQ
ncbi:MBG domain-containing protein [Prevotella communis]|uniref:MBG domain-containing protein n=1 Tax=Prevotella communis TaxID=2913614 RepID=UPI001EDA3336|nr:MBG domain-containing protein [Prevotella communis]UKK56824.1 tyrosine-protein phosphatase [Prevotella communis]